MKQKELKNLYSDILSRDVWKGDKKMIDYCVKKAAYIVELGNGDIIAIEKPKMETNFCFGYSDSRTDTESFDNANDMAHKAATNTDYFLSENLKDINKMIDRLEYNENCRYDFSNNHEFYIRIPYTGQPEQSRLKSMQCCNKYDAQENKYKRLEGEDRQRVIEGYKTVKTEFEKHLNNYLKRYGMSKINTWSYWRDE